MRKKDLESWVTEVAKLVAPEKIHWCDGSEEEKRVLIAEMLKTGDLLELNKKTHPNCFSGTERHFYTQVIGNEALYTLSDW